MENDTYYLKKNDGDIELKFVVTDDRYSSSICGNCFEYHSWRLDGTPVESSFVASVYCKWDTCTHWWFYGEDYDPEFDDKDSYYHLCGRRCFKGHIRAMCFIWKLCAELLKSRDESDIVDDYYDDEITTLIDFMLKDYTIIKGEGSDVPS